MEFRQMSKGARIELMGDTGTIERINHETRVGAIRWDEDGGGELQHFTAAWIQLPLIHLASDWD
jgi:hypothetical protein